MFQCIVVSRQVEYIVGEVPADAERIVVTNAGTLLPTLQALGVSIVGAPFPDEPIPAALVTEEDLEGSSRSDFPTSRSSASPTSTRT